MKKKKIFRFGFCHLMSLKQVSFFLSQVTNWQLWWYSSCNNNNTEKGNKKITSSLWWSQQLFVCLTMLCQSNSLMPKIAGNYLQIFFLSFSFQLYSHLLQKKKIKIKHLILNKFIHLSKRVSLCLFVCLFVSLFDCQCVSIVCYFARFCWVYCLNKYGSVTVCGCMSVSTSDFYCNHLFTF